MTTTPAAPAWSGVPVGPGALGAPATRSLRVVVLCTDLGVRLPGDKGASHHLRGVVRGFAQRCHDVLVVGVAGHGDPDLALAPGVTGGRIETLLLPHPGRSEGAERERRKRAFVASLPGRAGAVIDTFAPDLVYERLSLFGDAGITLAAARGIPHVVEVNALLAEEERRWRGLVAVDEAARIERHVLERSTLRVAVSNEVAHGLGVVLGTAAHPVVVVPNGVDGDRFATLPERATARRSLGLAADAAIAVFVGALRPWHGLEHAVDALVRLERVELVVAGDGPVRAELEAQAAAVGVAGRVHWLGQRDHRDIPTVLAAADVALAPYPPSAGFAFSPLKVLEYLAAGVPVVASDIGQLRTLLAGGRSGRLVRPGDAAALADAIEATLGDPAAQHTAAAARAQTLRHDTWASRVAEIVRALDTATAPSPRRTRALAG